MAIGFAAFSTALNINGTANIESNWRIEFTKIEEVSKTEGITIQQTPTASGTMATFTVGLKKPGDYIEYRITVENKGTLDAIIENIEAKENGTGALKFEIEGIRIGDKLGKNSSSNFIVRLSYDESVTSQPSNTSNSLTVTIDYVQDLGQVITPSDPSIESALLSTNILRDNVVQSDANIDFSQVSSDTNGKGLYYTNNNTEEGKAVYYFRGLVENNYVQFAGFYWRIIRINEDGSIRLIYQGTSANATGSAATIGSSAFNTNFDDNAYVGYMYGYPESSTLYGDLDSDGELTMKDLLTLSQILAGDREATNIQKVVGDINLDNVLNEADLNLLQTMLANSDTTLAGYATDEARYNATHANTNDSTIKGVLDTWYEENLLNNYATYLADTGFCGDRSIASTAGLWYPNDTTLGYGSNVTYYGTYNRLYNNKTPQFLCSQSNDLYTTASSNKGNKALDYPIGLITADEVAYAGGLVDLRNTSYYLYTGDFYWIMSPRDFSSSFAHEWRVFDIGSLGSGTVRVSSSGVRPVINLKSSVEIAGGNGTASNPYVVVTTE